MTTGSTLTDDAAGGGDDVNPAGAISNEYVDARHQRLSPGDVSRLTSTGKGVVVVFLDQGTVALADGEHTATDDVVAGSYHYVPGDASRVMTNVGAREVGFVVVQLVGLTGIDAPEGSLARVPLHELQEQDDRLEIYRVTFAPGAQTGMHYHPRKGFAVITRAGVLRTTLPDGTVGLAELSVGQMFWHEDRVRHQLENVGDTTLQVVDIEWK